MKHRALVVEDDPEVAEAVADILDSLGHDHDWACSQEEARARIAKGGYQYVLLDLQIPIRHGRGLACIEFGVHLAKEIRNAPSMNGAQVIVMTAHGNKGLELAMPLCGYGVAEFIAKPFLQTGRTLASVINQVLDRAGHRCQPGSSPQIAPQPRSFDGGVSTVKRALESLKSEGRVAFAGAARSGGFRLLNARSKGRLVTASSSQD